LDVLRSHPTKKPTALTANRTLIRSEN